MSEISAKIIADSKSKISGDRLTTFVITFPRIVLAEFNTHRMFSRNSASSRAIPFKKMVESVETNPFIPIAFQKDHSGMQGNQYFSGWREKVVRLGWITASKAAVFAAKKLSKLGLTKQLCNRLLEPFMYHTVIVTASEWQNFFALRHHEAAEIHIAKLAEEMLKVYNESTPKVLEAGEWHIPFGDKFDKVQLYTLIEADHGIYDPILSYEELHGGISGSHKALIQKYSLKIATAMCARISYTVVGEEGKAPNYENDIKLHDRLKDSGHFSPFEHCGQVMNDKEYAFDSSFNCDDGDDGTWGWSGNFKGFVQYRKILANENRKDPRVLKK
jgi:thymidylate synthase ThyX